VAIGPIVIGNRRRNNSGHCIRASAASNSVRRIAPPAIEKEESADTLIGQLPAILGILIAILGVLIPIAIVLVVLHYRHRRSDRARERRLQRWRSRARGDAVADAAAADGHCRPRRGSAPMSSACSSCRAAWHG
jgi:hypothetical protein